MKTIAALIISFALLSPCIAESSDPLVGSWRMRNYRTVIGTGPTDVVVYISGFTRASGTFYLIDYTSGVTSRVKDSEGSLIFKTVTTTYSRVPLKKNGDLYSFVLPEDNTLIRFKLKDDSLELVADDENLTQKKFEREIDNRAINSDKE